MTHAANGCTENEQAASVTEATPHEDGWYLYGITSISPDAPTLARARERGLGLVAAPLDLGPDHVRVCLLERASLGAVVRRVSLADFTPDALQARLEDPAMLRRAVQLHNDVIRAVHQRWAILPARFGAVYGRIEEIATAVDHRADALQAQLSRVDGCDEWAIHIYVDQQAVRETVRAEQAQEPASERLAAARPGRAYFLRRQLDEELASRTAQVIEEIALSVYQRIAESASVAVANWTASLGGDADGDVEVLRAAVLVRRERNESFVADVREADGDDQGWRCTISGPWPPYSFAAATEGDADGRQGT